MIFQLSVVSQEIEELIYIKNILFDRKAIRYDNEHSLRSERLASPSVLLTGYY